MTNLEYLIVALRDEIADNGAGWDSMIYYNIACPYPVGYKRRLYSGTDINRKLACSARHNDRMRRWTNEEARSHQVYQGRADWDY